MARKVLNKYVLYFMCIWMVEWELRLIQMVLTLIFLALGHRYKSRQRWNLSLIKRSYAGTARKELYFWGMKWSFLFQGVVFCLFHALSYFNIKTLCKHPVTSVPYSWQQQWTVSVIETYGKNLWFNRPFCQILIFQTLTRVVLYSHNEILDSPHKQACKIRLIQQTPQFFDCLRYWTITILQF